MAKRLSPDDILARNPEIDRDQLEEAREALRRLREMGVQRKGYDVVSPFGGGHRVSVHDEKRNEPRQLRVRPGHDTAE